MQHNQAITKEEEEEKRAKRALNALAQILYSDIFRDAKSDGIKQIKEILKSKEAAMQQLTQIVEIAKSKKQGVWQTAKSAPKSNIKNTLKQAARAVKSAAGVANPDTDNLYTFIANIFPHDPYELLKDKITIDKRVFQVTGTNATKYAGNPATLFHKDSSSDTPNTSQNWKNLIAYLEAEALLYETSNNPDKERTSQKYLADMHFALTVRLDESSAGLFLQACHGYYVNEQVLPDIIATVFSKSWVEDYLTNTDADPNDTVTVKNVKNHIQQCKTESKTHTPRRNSFDQD